MALRGVNWNRATVPSATRRHDRLCGAARLASFGARAWLRSARELGFVRRGALGFVRRARLASFGAARLASFGARAWLRSARALGFVRVRRLITWSIPAAGRGGLEELPPGQRLTWRRKPKGTRACRRSGDAGR